MPLIRGLSSPRYAGLGVDQVVHLEETEIALARELVAELARELPGPQLLLGRERGRIVVARPAATVRGQLRMPGDVVHERPDERAVAGQDGLDRYRAMLDPAHHLQRRR